LDEAYFLRLVLVLTRNESMNIAAFLIFSLSFILNPTRQGFYINRVKKLRFLPFFLADCIVRVPYHKEIF